MKNKEKGRMRPARKGGVRGRFRPRFRRPKKEAAPEWPMRLNKYLAHAGIASRRRADELIKNGMVTVNGEVITEMGYKVNPEDEVRFGGEPVVPEKKVYVLLNKPKNYITTTKDERNRKTVMDLVKDASKYRLYPVGRLDRKTTGVLLLTNDGQLAEKLLHPKNKVEKIYHVVLDRNLKQSDMQKIREGLKLNDGMIYVDEISYIQGAPRSEVGVKLHSGRNRIVRRIFKHLGYDVKKLDRVMFAGLTKKGLERGQWRYLTDKEVSFLKML
ncbi:MAG: rRNA pseudouridine synthase [Chlorobi bacterium]|nr:rRNA pseudouridine synthase [Chlorobiota bacterium]